MSSQPQTHLPLRSERGGEALSRNHLNVLSADVVIALPGGPGTASEVTLALRYGRPLVAHLERREEILDLPEDVPLEPSLDGVKIFVLRTLGYPESSGP